MFSRRKFIEKSSKLVGAACLLPASGLLTACASVYYIEGVSKKENVLEVSLSEIEGKEFALIEHESLKAPVLIKTEAGKHSAVLLYCTHKGCSLQPAGSILICPCHGAEFNREGKVLSGPAIESLFMNPVEVKDDKLLITIL
jgi:cytochrome b6-f complex iron-sulfur subunit